MQKMERFINKEIDLKTISPVTLAFVGDGVFDLMVREMLVCEANRPSGELHKIKVGMVRAEAQAEAVDMLMEHFTDQETAVYKRGRNAKTSRNSCDYHKSTGLEAVFGYLYLDGEIERVRELYNIIFEEIM